MLLTSFGSVLLVATAILAKRKNITIGGIIADKSELPFALHRTGPAIEMGVEKLREIIGDEADVTFILNVTTEFCVADMVGAIAAEMYYKHKVSAFIGPACSSAVDVVGRMAGYWNYPILTPVGTDNELGNKNDFRTLTRLAFNYEHLGRFYRSVFREFNWTDITVIYDVMGTHVSRKFNRLIGENLHKEFVKTGLTCTLLKFVSDSPRDYIDVLTTANRTSRVFAVSCDSVALRELMIVAHSLGMLEGDYVFIYFESFRGNGNGNIHWRRGDQYDEIVRKAYESMMVVSLFKPSSSHFKTFESIVKERSIELYNFSFDALQYDVSPYVTAFYDAFTVYGQVLKETIKAGQDYNDANEINRRMWNRTFDGVGGYLQINSNGDREMDMMLLDLNPESGEYELISLAGDEISIVNMKYKNTLVATYKGAKVFLFKFKRNLLPTSEEFLRDLLKLRTINCNNLTKFIGLTEGATGIYAVNEYCTRGDLRDILSNDSFTLNWDFRASLVCDIIQAMDYIHNSNIKYHGHLTSMNCVIDSRFVLKVTEFGIQSLRDFDIDITKKESLWAAPEAIRQQNAVKSVQEMQYADVYSFGIILYEILSRKEPFEDDQEFLTFKEIIMKIKYVEETPFRPRLDADSDKDMVSLMRICWDENPKSRPTFSTIKKEATRLRWDKTGDKFLDNLLSRMEEYANNLEDLVQERTQAFLDEKRRSEELLYQVLPRSVADELKHGRMVNPEAFACVTVYFSDIVDFTSLSSESTPMQIVDLLNDLYTCFDKIIENFDVYKVETIGDAYIVVSGLPVRNGNKHVEEIAKMSTIILDNVKIFKIRHKPNVQLRARIGLHSGPVCAGVVGRKMPRYCLFGDTVNTASRMESTGEALKIHVSESTRNFLSENQDFKLEKRGEIPVKGKGFMNTYWLTRNEAMTEII